MVVAAPGRVELVEQEAAALRAGTFRVRTRYSGISAGTELSYVKGTNPYLHVSWDAEPRPVPARRAGTARTR